MNKEQLLLYAITDHTDIDNAAFFERIEQALQGGITILQLREKNISEEEFINIAATVKEMCKKYHVPLIINDNLNVALKSDADGVHVGIEDLPVGEIRKQVGKDFLIGATAKTVEQAQKAEAEGADYLGVGAVFPSPTKKNVIRITKQQLLNITSCVSIPSVAIGGITLDNMLEIEGSGMCGVAVVSAIFGAENIPKACRLLKQMSLKVTMK